MKASLFLVSALAGLSYGLSNKAAGAATSTTEPNPFEPDRPPYDTIYYPEGNQSNTKHGVHTPTARVGRYLGPNWTERMDVPPPLITAAPEPTAPEVIPRAGKSKSKSKTKTAATSTYSVVVPGIAVGPIDKNKPIINPDRRDEARQIIPPSMNPTLNADPDPARHGQIELLAGLLHLRVDLEKILDETNKEVMERYPALYEYLKSVEEELAMMYHRVHSDLGDGSPRDPEGIDRRDDEAQNPYIRNWSEVPRTLERVSRELDESPSPESVEKQIEVLSYLLNTPTSDSCDTDGPVVSDAFLLLAEPLLAPWREDVAQPLTKDEFLELCFEGGLPFECKYVSWAN